MSTPVLDHGYVSLVETWGSDEIDKLLEAVYDTPRTQSRR